MLRKRTTEPTSFQSKKAIATPLDKTNAVNEREMLVLAVFFIACGAALFFMIQITLIPILTASRVFISFGLVGFFLAYLLRKQLHIGVLDGLYYNVFTVAPACMVVFLGVNMMDAETYTETYKITSHELHGDRYEFELENGAYTDFWRIRTILIELRPARSAYIKFTFSDGLLGYKVLRKIELD